MSTGSNRVHLLKPKQRLPFSKKNKEWRIDSYNFFTSQCGRAIDPARAYKLYRMANGELDELEYNFVTNPLNTTRLELRGYPAKIRNYDIISPVVNMFMGEKRERDFPPIVFARNSDIDSVRKLVEIQLVNKELQNIFYNELVKYQVIESEEQGLMGFDEIRKRVDNIPDQMAEDGQNAIDNIIYKNEVDRLFIEGFYHWICVARVFTYKDILNDDLFYSLVSPLYFRFFSKEDTEFVEDMEAGSQVKYMTSNEIYDGFSDLTEEEGWTKELEDYLDSFYTDTTAITGATQREFQSYSDNPSPVVELFRSVFGDLGEYNDRAGVEVIHTTWRSAVKYYELEIENIFGETIIVEVDENYIPAKGDKITEKWRDQIWEGTKIADRFYLAIRPLPVSIYNKDKAKLPYNGRLWRTRHSDPQSPMEKMEPYQKNYNITKYRMEHTLGKNLDAAIVIPMGLIPDKEGWDEFTVLYYLQALGVLFIDETRKNSNAALQALKSVDMSLWKYVVQGHELLAAIKREMYETLGVSPERLAQIDPNVGKGVQQESIVRSSIISSEMFSQYEEFEKREYEGFMQLSKYIHSDGTQETFYRSDGQKALLNIYDPERYVNTDFGVYVKNSSKEKRKLDQLKSFGQAFAQNQAKPSTVAKLIHSDNYTEIMKELDRMEEELNMAQQQAAMQEQEHEMNIAEMEAQDKQLDRDLKRYEIDTEAKTKLEEALIRSGSSPQEFRTEVRDIARNLEVSSLEAQDRIDKRQGDAEKMEIEKEKLKVQRETNQTALKNKVPGEK